MKILMTGGTGVAGTGAVPALLGAGHRVRLLSRHATHDAKGFPSGVEAFDADIAESTDLAAAIEGCDAVLHLAGIVEEQPPAVTFEKINVLGTQRLLEACARAGAPGFIYLSSLGADRGESEYHRSKLRAEREVQQYSGPWVIVRPGAIYGPHDETLSMLLKMVRTLPAVPMVGKGEQPFQPMWYADLGRALEAVVSELPRFAGKTLEVSGIETTTTEEVLSLMSEITERTPAHLPVPAWIAKFGTWVLESFGATGQSAMKRLGITPPINSQKLSMLVEGNVIAEGRTNALVSELHVTPTPLRTGLRQLSELIPEQILGSGVGEVKMANFWADIEGSPFKAEQLLDRVCEHINDVMLIEFSAEPGAPETAKEGLTLTAEIKGRGNVQVRLDERTANEATFVTLESHPLAGIMQMRVRSNENGVRFTVRTIAQAADAADWVALKTFGEFIQHGNWRGVVRRVVELSQGKAPGGVQQQVDTLDEEQANAVKAWVTRIVQARQRENLERNVAAASATTSSGGA